jgi:hypothetical protein
MGMADVLVSQLLNGVSVSSRAWENGERSEEAAQDTEFLCLGEAEGLFWGLQCSTGTSERERASLHGTELQQHGTLVADWGAKGEQPKEAGARIHPRQAKNCKNGAGTWGCDKACTETEVSDAGAAQGPRPLVSSSARGFPRLRQDSLLAMPFSISCSVGDSSA